MIERLKRCWSLALAVAFCIGFCLWVADRAEPGLDIELLQGQVNALEYRLDVLEKRLQSQGEWIERFDKHFRHLMGTS